MSTSEEERTNIIEKFPFSSDANASDVGDLSQGRSGPAGSSSSTNGYTAGGFDNGAPQTTITGRLLSICGSALRISLDSFSHFNDGPTRPMMEPIRP